MPLPPWARRTLAAAVVALALAGLGWLFRELVLDVYRTATYTEMNAAKVLALVAAGLVLLLALPLAILEGVASRRFRRAERDLRQARPHDAVTPYEGPEGRGLAFEGPEGRALLLRPAGFGGPLVLVFPPPPAPDAAEGALPPADPSTPTG